MQEKIERIAKWSMEEEALPWGIEFNQTLRCNLRCKFCWREPTKINHNNELSLNDYKKVINEAAKLKVKEVKIIGGGEPLCKDETIEIMKLIKKNNMFGYICTNGTLFKEKDIKELVEIGWDHLKISLHGPCNTHDFLTGAKGSFNAAIKNIKLFVKYKKRLKRKKPFIEIGVVLVNKNYDKLIEMFRLAKKLDLQAVFIEPVTVYSDLGGKLKLNKKQEEEFEKIARMADKIAIRSRIQTNLPYFFDSKLIEKTNKMTEVMKNLPNPKENDFFSIPCYEPFYRMGIRVDGTVGPCGFFDEESPENIKKKSLKEIWFGPYLKIRRNQMLKRRLPAYCAKCCTTLVVNNQEVQKQLRKCTGN